MIVEFSNVSMTYKAGVHALKNVSFKIDNGEFVFIIGRSGSGKSTLIKLLTCEERASAGKVFIDNFEISRLRRGLVPYLRRNIGMVFQDFRLINSKTVYQNIAFGMEIVGAKSELIRKRVPMVLSVVGLRDKAHMHPYQLSGGEQQRVAIARAMVNNPTLILADEPTGNLDPINSEAIMALLRDINDGGTTVVICTHDATMVNKLKQRVIEIADGHLIRDDALGEYNLSAEVRKKNKKEKIDCSPKLRRMSGKSNASVSDQSPFVRNINIKFSDIGSDENQTEGFNEDSEEINDENLEDNCFINPEDNSDAGSDIKSKSRDVVPVKNSDKTKSDDATENFEISAVLEETAKTGKFKVKEFESTSVKVVEPLGGNKVSEADEGAKVIESGKRDKAIEAKEVDKESSDVDLMTNKVLKKDDEEKLRKAVEYYMNKSKNYQKPSKTKDIQEPGKMDEDLK